MVQRIARISSPYFLSEARTTAHLWPFGRYSVKLGHLAVALIVFLVVLNQAQVGVSLRLNFFYRDFYNALQEKNAEAFWYQLIFVFCVWAAISAITQPDRDRRPIGAADPLARMDGGRIQPPLAQQRHALPHLARRHRRQPRPAHRRGYARLPQPDLFLLADHADAGLDAGLVLDHPVDDPGRDHGAGHRHLVIPGFIFWATLIYAAVATWITHLIGKPLIALDFEQERREANFRFSLARLREYSEQIALMHGEYAERQHLGAQLLGDRREFLRADVAQAEADDLHPRPTTRPTSSSPIVLLAPYYFAGAITFGVLNQVASAFGRVETAMSFFINSYQSIASYLASINRLTTFEAAIAQAQAADAGDKGIHQAKAAGAAVHVDDAVLTLPNGQPIVRVNGLDLGAQRRTLVVGPSGSGKSTLFRAIAGIWPFGEGKVGIPAGADIMLLPQRPYLPQGSLRAAIAYPSEEHVYSDADIRAAMDKVKLGHLADRLDEVDLWGQRLSGGEQQRLAVARALLAKPDWLFLDEATASLDEKLEGEIYALIDKALPETRIVSIGHRSTLRDDARRGRDDGAQRGRHLQPDGGNPRNGRAGLERSQADTG